MNRWGRIFCVSIFGESHGAGIGVTIDGCPAGIPLDANDFLADLDRRKAGLKGTTPRKEPDVPVLLSGVFDKYTTGAPLTIWFDNTNIRPKDYSAIVDQARPGHADFVAQKKYHSCNDYRGGGHFSGRLTLALVAAAVVAKKIIKEITINAKIESVGGSKDIEETINKALITKESVGGIVVCHSENIPVGWGEPFFDSIESTIAHLAFAVPAIKGIEFGSGFKAASMKGSEHNDLIINENGRTETNNNGGVSGGISNGNPLIFRVAIKPTSSIAKTQKTWHAKTKKTEPLTIEGRHDTCIALRVPVVIEAITAIALADFKLLRQTQLKYEKKEDYEK